MSVETEYYTLVKLDTGEEPGTWGLVLNSNLDIIDSALNSIKNSNASLSEPVSVNDGTLWYDLALESMKVYRNGNFDFLLNHKHGVTAGVSAIDLSDNLQTEGQLPASKINKVGLIAEKLDNGSDGIPLSGLAAYLTGGGLTSSLINGESKISLIEVPGLDTENYKTKFILDVYGKIVSASRPTSIIDLGITDVYTKTVIETTFSSKSHNHDLSYAPINGSIANFFNVKTPAKTDTSTFAINLEYVINNLAEKYGSNSTVFNVANVVLADNDNTNLSGAVNKQTAEARYAKLGHLHSDLYEPLGTLHNDLYIRRDGQTAMEAILTLFSSNPTEDYHAVHKKYLETYTAATYALKGGDVNQVFKVKNAVLATEAVALGQATTLFAQKSHAHSYATTSELLLIGNQIKEEVLEANMLQLSSERQSIASCRHAVDGTPDWLTGAANLLTLHVDGALAQAFTISLANGFNSNGDINQIIDIPKDDTGDSNKTHDTTSLGNATHFLFYSNNKYDFAYKSNGAFAAAATIIRLSQADKVELSSLPDSGKIKVELTNGDIWVFPFSVYIDIGYEDRSYIRIFNYDINGVNQGLPNGIDDLEYIYIVDNSSQDGLQVAPGPDALQIELLELESTELAPVYGKIKPVAPASGQVWFNTTDTVAYKYTGSEWIVRPCIEIAKFVKSGGNITSVTPYGVGTKVPSWDYANKATGATTDNFASFDSLGNIKDSGKKSSDFAAVAGSAAQDFATKNVTVAETASGPKFKITAEGGYAIKLTNRTGLVSIKGQVVTTDTNNDESYVRVPLNSAAPIGIVYDAGIADGSGVWVVVSGIAEVLIKSGLAIVRGDVLLVAGTADVGAEGRAIKADAVPPSTTADHFREIGHAVSAGTDVLIKTVLHFN